MVKDIDMRKLADRLEVADETYICKGLQQGFVQVYTGEGKGKSTAAFGLCMRAVGTGLDVCIVQFVKLMRCGEHESADILGIDIFQPNASDDDLVGARKQWERVCEIVRDASCDVLVLDEIMEAIRREQVSVAEVVSLIDKKPEQMELILTGRKVPDEIADRANLITEMRPIMHYFSEGVVARKGIEY